MELIGRKNKIECNFVLSGNTLIKYSNKNVGVRDSPNQGVRED